MTFTVAELFDLAQTGHAALFDGCKFPWDALKKIEPYLDRVTKQNPPPRFPGATIGDRVIIGEGTTVEPGAMIKGPAIIGKNCQIRHNAYIRENVIIGDGCVGLIRAVDGFDPKLGTSLEQYARRVALHGSICQKIDEQLLRVLVVVGGSCSSSIA